MSQLAPPEPAPIKGMRAPRVSRDRIRGLDVYVVRKPTVPKVDVQLSLPMGKRPAGGAAERVLAATLTSGTASATANDMAEELQTLGASLQASAVRDRLAIHGSVLSSGLTGLFDILADVLVAAAYPDAEVDLERSRATHEITMLRGQPSYLAGEAFLKQMFAAHPYATAQPTPAAVARVTASKLRRVHAELVRPARASLIVVGDLVPARALKTIGAALSGWRGRPQLAAVPQPTPRTGGPVVVVDRPGAVQTNIRMGTTAVGRSHEDAPAIAVANAIFGAMFSSRLVSNIREDKGYTYSPRSSVDHLSLCSLLTLGADVGTDVTAAALHEIRYELGRMATTSVSDEELEAAKRYLVGTMSIATQPQHGLASLLSELAVHGLGLDHIREVPLRIAKVTAEDVRRVGARYFAPSVMTTVLLGDLDRMMDEVAALGPVRVA